jgi:hypothetical protein
LKAGFRPWPTFAGVRSLGGGAATGGTIVLPPDVRRRFGYALSLAQMGDQDDAAKVLKGFGGAGLVSFDLAVERHQLLGAIRPGRVQLAGQHLTARVVSLSFVSMACGSENQQSEP